MVVKSLIETEDLKKRVTELQVFTLASMMAHNFSREMQMVAHPAASRAKAKRPAAWTFQKLETIRRQIIQRAGRLNTPAGKIDSDNESEYCRQAGFAIFDGRVAKSGLISSKLFKFFCNAKVYSRGFMILSI